MIAKLYRKLIPSSIRTIIYKAFLGSILIFFRELDDKIKCKWYKLIYLFIEPKSEKAKAFRDWGNAGPTPYPYSWKKEYDSHRFEVHIDDKKSLPYVWHNDKKLYFKKDTRNVADAYKFLLIEQDERSAHRYVKSYKDLMGKTLLDIGAAEAIFTLDVIEYINHAYLFESDESWIEALNATFTPWKEKITIVRKYVSDVNDENNVTLDAFFKDKLSENLFVKMDIEGYERKALKGCNKLFARNQNISGSVCIYHLSDDEEAVSKILKHSGLTISVQPGYLYYGKNMRHAIVRFHSSCL